MSAPEKEDSFEHRDGLVFRMLGWFFLVFGVLVWLGLLWPQSTEGKWVNAMAGAILLLVGGLTVWLGRRSLR